ncbi:MAG: PAS domain S-box protein [Deltaproteobacteria bacterium]|jgi:PAS domain S-box-containing protein|nr:PAS domain S-box protein [Deltaproteobacteria bacterium]
MLTIDALKAETTIPVIIVDHEGTVVHINQMFEKTWGWQKEVLVDQSLTTIIPDNLRDAHRMGFSRFLLTGIPTILNQALELVVMRADGKEAAAQHFIIAEKINDNWVFGATIKPLLENDGISR